MSTSGIYLITHKSSGKIYIGQSVNIKHRWWVHGAMGSECVKLRNAIQKYGKDQFELTILEEVNEKKLLTEREQFYLDSYQPFGDNGYNICRVANAGPAIKGQPKTGIMAAGVNNRNNVPVNSYDSNGNLIAEYYSVKYAAASLNINKAGIFNCLAGRSRVAGGYFWARSGEYPIFRNVLSNGNKGKKYSLERIAKMSEATKQNSASRGKPAATRRPVYGLLVGKIELSFDCIKEAALFCGGYSSSIFNAIKTGYKAYGYNWSYKVDS